MRLCRSRDRASAGQAVFAPVGERHTRQLVFRGARTRPASEEAEAAAKALVAADSEGVVAGCTVGQWLAHWLTTKAALRPSTRQGYATHIRLYLIPHLGRIRLHELASRDINALLAALAAHPSPTGRRLSPATVVRIHATLRTALNAAVRTRFRRGDPRATAVEAGREA
jgi:hypothetical protein